ncbi:MAG: choice-of-anchor D domain-containing protein [Myxococcaceae bacterium]
MSAWPQGRVPALRLLFALAPIALWSCSHDRVVDAPCQDDSQCASGTLCENFRCVPAETKSCDVVIDGNPILQPDPYSVQFGELDGAESTTTIKIHNIGNCTLTLFEATLEKGDASPFTCDLCTAPMPIEIFPGREKEVQVSFKAPTVGTYDDAIKILSDDKEFPELKVPLHANFIGTPDLRVQPNPVDFGYVAMGRMNKKAMQISNQGTGTAPITVNKVAFDPADTQDFELVGAPTSDVTLKPISISRDAVIAFEVQYHPRSSAQHHVDLVITNSKGELRIPVSGNSETPPKLTFSPTSIDLGKVPLGHTNVQPLTLLNEGGAPLNISYSWGGPNPTTDLYGTPAVLPAIVPGAYVDLQIAFTATSIGQITGLLVLTTNDPSKPSVTIPVTAEGIQGPGPEVVKIDMTFDNGTDGVFDKDIRNVDMTLEHPYGYVCNKGTPAPTNWGNYGNPSWISFAPKEEPERIVLADATQDGKYRVMLTYMEDCKSLPTELLAGILGISVDALVTYLSSGVINVNGQDVSQLISNVCLSHGGSNATVRVYVNGTLIKEKTASLSHKGDNTYVLDLIRNNGTFSAQ